MKYTNLPVYLITDVQALNCGEFAIIIAITLVLAIALVLALTRKITAVFQASEKYNIYSRYVGKYVIVRSSNEGINAGRVEDADETGIILSDARRMWYHKPKDIRTSWYEGVAQSGLSDDSKVSAPVIAKAIVEKYSITVCSEEAEFSIVNHPSYEQN